MRYYIKLHTAGAREVKRKQKEKGRKTSGRITGNNQAPKQNERRLLLITRELRITTFFSPSEQTARSQRSLFQSEIFLAAEGPCDAERYPRTFR